MGSLGNVVSATHDPVVSSRGKATFIVEASLPEVALRLTLNNYNYYLGGGSYYIFSIMGPKTLF